MKRPAGEKNRLASRVIVGTRTLTSHDGKSRTRISNHEIFCVKSQRRGWRTTGHLEAFFGCYAAKKRPGPKTVDTASCQDLETEVNQTPSNWTPDMS
jgi:hypothetical protein